MTPAALLLFTALRFVSPLEGSQAVGPQWVEVTTDAAGVDRIEFTIDGVLAGVARKAPWRIAHDFGTALAPHTITAKLWANGYQASETATITTAALTAGASINVDLVEVPMRVHASHLLKPGDITVKENGIVQDVRAIKPERGPAHFMFVIDRSLSMGEGKLTATLRAVDAELHSLRPGDTAAVVLFNHNVSRPRPIAPGEKTAEIFGDVEPSGGTSLYDALASIAGKERTFVIVITDGGDRNSELTADAALRQISNRNTVVDAIVLGWRSDFLGRAAKNTGGEFVKASKETIGQALHDLIAEINSRYLLIYQSHGNGPGWRAIDIKPRSRDVAVLRARKGYFSE